MDELYIELTLLFVLIILTRLLYLMHKITTGHSKEAPQVRKKPCVTMICIGSGGHTTEMLKLVEVLDFTKYSPRYYVMAKSDITSTSKVEMMETNKDVNKNSQQYSIIQIPRSRVVGQSYFTSVFTTLYSILYSIPVVCKLRPDLLLCNGPGTCVPLCVITFLLKAAFISDTRIIFIESYCRTRTFSLSGKILMYFADNILVQWPKLTTKLKRADYIGQLL